MVRRTLAIVLVALAASSVVMGQRSGSSVAPVRVVSARLVAADSGDGIPYGRVTVMPAGAARTEILRTDLEGRFTITVPAAGRAARVTKAGFVPQEVMLNAATPAEILMVRGGVIAGRVIVDGGDPVPNARIRAERADTEGPPFTGNGQTDDRGEYRIGGLPPGRYRVSLDSFAYEPGKMSYPAAENPADATLVPVAAGRTQSGIDMVMRKLRSGTFLMTGGMSVIRISPVAFPPVVADADGGTVRGAVRSTEGRTLDHAQVQLLMEGRGGSLRAQNSDAAGRFEFNALPPGRYRLQAFKVGYSAADGSADRPESLVVGRVVEVRANTVRDREDVELAPWGIITGRILDEYGDPVAGARPSLYAVRYESGRRGLVPESVGFAPSDDEGTYRIFGVPPGSYVVGAEVGDAATTDTAGYARTFYPASSSPSQAQFVAVRRSQTVYGIDVPLEPAPSMRVSGRLLDIAGAPTTGGSLQLIPRVSSTATIGVASGAIIHPDGQFEFRNVTPGAYVIKAWLPPSGASVEAPFGVLPVNVVSDSVSGLTLRLSAGSPMSGHVTYESADTERERPSGVEIAALPVDLDTAPQQYARTQVAADATFALSGVNGSRRLRVRAPQPWALKEITLNGVDITDRVLTLTAATRPLSGIQIVLSDRLARVSGRVTDAQNRGIPGATVIAFSIDRDTWYPESRFVRMGRSGDDGGYAIAGLPAGTYQVAAVARLAPGTDAWQDPVFLEELSRVTRTTAVGDGEQQTLPLRLTEP